MLSVGHPKYVGGQNKIGAVKHIISKFICASGTSPLRQKFSSSLYACTVIAKHTIRRMESVFVNKLFILKLL